MRFRYLFFLAIIIFTPVEARMYQWNDPGTGTTQLSGKPPTWYRSGNSGPRVIVFDKGKVVDDTAILISDEQRISLRNTAFQKVEEDKQIAMEKSEQMKKLQSIMEDRESESAGNERGSELFDFSLDLQAESDDEDIVVDSEEKESKKDLTAEMQRLIKEWEQLQTEEARKLLKP